MQEKMSLGNKPIERFAKQRYNHGVQVRIIMKLNWTMFVEQDGTK